MLISHTKIVAKCTIKGCDLSVKMRFLTKNLEEFGRIKSALILRFLRTGIEGVWKHKNAAQLMDARRFSLCDSL